MQIEVLGERYQLQDPIGRGGMATIYRGRDMRMDRIVAIKMLRAGDLGSSGGTDRFLREARSVAQLRHPSIVPADMQPRLSRTSLDEAPDRGRIMPLGRAKQRNRAALLGERAGEVGKGAHGVTR